MTVRRIGALTQERCLTPETIATRLDLSLEQVKTALAYYYDHYDKMRALDRKREQAGSTSQEAFDPEVLGANRRDAAWSDRSEDG